MSDSQTQQRDELIAVIEFTARPSKPYGFLPGDRIAIFASGRTALPVTRHGAWKTAPFGASSIDQRASDLIAAAWEWVIREHAQTARVVAPAEDDLVTPWYL